MHPRHCIPRPWLHRAYWKMSAAHSCSNSLPEKDKAVSNYTHKKKMMHRFSASSFLYFQLDALSQCINIRFYLILRYFTRTTRYLLVLQKI